MTQSSSPRCGALVMLVIAAIVTVSPVSATSPSRADLGVVMDRVEGALKDLAATTTAVLGNRSSTVSLCRSAATADQYCTPRACDNPLALSDAFNCYFANTTGADSLYGNVDSLCTSNSNSSSVLGLLRSVTDSVAVFPHKMNYSSLEAESFMCATKALDPHFKSKMESGDLAGFQYLVEASTGATRKYPGIPSNDTQCSQGLDGFPWLIQSTTGPKDVMVIYDMSSSMKAADGPGGLTRFAGAKLAVMAILDTLSAGDRIGLVWFDRAAHKQSGDVLMYATPTNVTNLKQLVNELPQDGSGTNFEAGFTKAFDVLQNSPVRESGLVLQPTLLFLTDGSPNTGETSRSAFLALVDGWQSGLAKPAVIMTYNLGDDGPGPVRIPQAIACANQGVWEFIDQGESIGEIMGRYYKIFRFGTQVRIGPPTVGWTEPYYRNSWDNEPVVSASIPIYANEASAASASGMIAILATDVTLTQLGLPPSISAQTNHSLLLDLIQSRNTHIRTTTNFSWCQLQSLRSTWQTYVCEDDEAPAGAALNCAGTPAPKGSPLSGSTAQSGNVNLTLCEPVPGETAAPHLGGQPMCCLNSTNEPTPLPPAVPTAVPTPVPTPTPTPGPTPAPPAVTQEPPTPAPTLAPPTPPTPMPPAQPLPCTNNDDCLCPATHCKSNGFCGGPPCHVSDLTPAPTAVPTAEPPMPPPTHHCNTSADCPCSYCMTGSVTTPRNPPYWCHRDPSTACTLAPETSAPATPAPATTPVPPVATPQPTPAPTAAPAATPQPAATTTASPTTTEAIASTPADTSGDPSASVTSGGPTVSATGSNTTADPEGTSNSQGGGSQGRGDTKTITLTQTLTLSKSLTLTPVDSFQKSPENTLEDDGPPYWIIGLVLGLLLCCLVIFLGRRFVLRDKGTDPYWDGSKYTKDFIVDVDQNILEGNERVVAMEDTEVTLKYIMKQKQAEAGQSSHSSGESAGPPDLEALLQDPSSTPPDGIEITSKAQKRNVNVYDDVELDEMKEMTAADQTNLQARLHGGYLHKDLTGPPSRLGPQQNSEKSRIEFTDI